MNRNLKILLAAILFTTILTQEKICEHLGFGQNRFHDAATDEKPPKQSVAEKEAHKSDSLINDTLYRWDDQLMRWTPVEDMEDNQTIFTNYVQVAETSLQPLEIEWKLLMDIQYVLRYFEETDMEMYAPIFGHAQKALDGREVIIDGFVIPFDEDEEILSLSAYPYASCFFCGKASPASIISMYLKNKGQRYKVDDFKKFRGTLHLNIDDPNEFYYILRDAREN